MIHALRWLPLLLLGCGPALAAPPAGPAPAPAESPRGFAGLHVEPVAILSAAQRTALGVREDHGSVVAFVMPGGPADRAGVRVGDLVLTLDGRPAPDVTVGDRYDATHRAWRAAMRAWNDGLEAGRPVEIGVRRGETTTSLRVVPVPEAEMHRIMGGDEAPFPSPDEAGKPAAWREGFDGLSPGGGLPAGWRPYEGRWQAVAGPNGRGAVLRQDRPVLPWAVLLVTGAGRSVADGVVRVRFEPVSGIVDASAGIVFRARDPRNYYVVRANALEDNWNLYVVKDGVRTAVKEMRVTPPPLGTWHTMEVRFVGDAFTATLDGKDVVEGRDGTFRAGWVGLWTKADSVTRFDDLEVEPSAP
jgi:hypothetical protein